MCYTSGTTGLPKEYYILTGLHACFHHYVTNAGNYSNLDTILLVVPQMCDGMGISVFMPAVWIKHGATLF
jgi:acyl-coenzyme A synthetase/AMP-(fatty) acid ligase